MLCRSAISFISQLIGDVMDGDVSQTPMPIGSTMSDCLDCSCGLLSAFGNRLDRNIEVLTDFFG